MALIVEDGSGLAAAESYISIADANTYFLNHYEPGKPIAWLGSTDTEKEIALRVATRHINNEYNTSFVGTKSTLAQALAWPRSSAIDSHGYSIDSTGAGAIPTFLKQAVSELALRFREDPSSLDPDVSTDSGIAAESVSLGPISESITYMGVKPTAKKFSIVKALLSTLLAGGGSKMIDRS